MSINHFSSSELPGTIWWTQHHHQSSAMEQIPQNATGQNTRNTPFDFNLNQEDDDINEDRDTKLEEEVEEEAKEAMFEKPLTPSDVGKLNRLVIPKQHAEKYFPLGGNNVGGESVEKGLLLSFEDESGKTWRFRYSYWNSSQSYVLTKGWSRFVKEKRLEAGDVVVFDRFRSEGERFFIGWRRRNAAAAVPENMATSAGWNRVYYSGYPYHGTGTTTTTTTTSLPYQTQYLHAGGGGSAGGTQTTPPPSGNSKTVLRLFGVNLECQSDEPQHYHSNHHSHMQDTNFSRTR